MKKLALLAALLLSVGLIVALLVQPIEWPVLTPQPIPAPEEVAEELREAPPSASPPLAGDASALGEDQREELPAVTATKELRDAEWPRCLVRGRVLSVSGSPLAGAAITLNTVGEPWVRPEDYDGEFPPTKQLTGPDGRFSFDLPLPTSSWISLDVSHLPFHVRAGRNFGLAGGRNEPPLIAGENDLGDLVLADAGAFAGRVFAEDGTPLQGARVSLSGSFPGGYSAGASTDETGAYQVGGVPAGRHTAKARKDGYLILESDAIDVEDGRVSSGHDFRLPRAATISGRVVDEEGAALAGVKLWGWPEGGGRGAGGRTSADGHFEISLPQPVPYSLGAELAGFEPIEEDSSVRYAPGETGIVLVMQRHVLATFRVVDARTGTPIERFGLKILRVRTKSGASLGSSDHDVPARLREAEGGEALLAADPHLDRYSIVAPGYGDQRGRVAWDTAGVRSMTIELEPEGVISGRAIAAGSAVGPTVLELKRARIPLRPGVTEGEDDIFSRDWGTDLDRFAGRLQQVTGAADGRFELRGLQAGTYQVVLRTQDRAPLTLERVVVRAGEVTDLGEVELFGPSSLGGVVLLGAVSPAGLSLSLGDKDFADDETAQTLDLTGKFHFKDLPAGKTYLWLEPKPGVLLPGPPLEFELGHGEERYETLDLEDRAPCRVEVLVKLSGEAAPGVLIEVRRETDLKRTVGRTARTASDGLALLDAPGTGKALLVLSGPKNLPIGRTTEQIALEAGAKRSLTVELPAGRVLLALPPGLAVERRIFNVRREGSDESQAWTVWFETEEHAEDQLDLGWLRPGTYSLSSVQLPGSPELRGEVTVSAGQTATCVLSQ